MKKIEAIIRPAKVDDIREDLVKLGVQGLTAIEVRGFGRQKGHKEIYRGSEYQVSFQPKIKIEVVVDDSLEDKVIDVISKNAKTGQIGDGKIFISDISNAIRIRTGEVGAEAL